MNKSQIFKNVFSGVLGQIITLSLGILLPRLFILSFGSEMNGLLSSINQFYVYVGLLEAGVGTATLQALYSPIAHENKGKVNGILSATNSYYYKTGLFYGLAVILFSLIYPLFVNTNINFLTVFLVILLSGMGNAIIYFFHGKYKILLNADGKGYIVTNIATITTIFSSCIKIILILCNFNVVIVQLSFFIINIAQVIFFSFYIKKHYKWIDLTTVPDLEAISKKGSVLIHQLSALIFSNTDIIVLTIFCDLKVVSVYALYNLLFSSISNVLSSLNSSITYVLGQTYQKSVNKFVEMVDCYELYYTMLNFICYTLALIFSISFLKLYTRGITDANYIDSLLVVLFVGISILTSARTAMSNVINITGHFKETQYRSILESLINIFVSIFSVFKLGIYGVLIGTICALLYRTNDIIIYSNKKILNRNPTRTYFIVLLNLCLMFFTYFIFSTYILSWMNVNTYISLFVGVLFSTVIVATLFFVVNSIAFNKSFNYLINNLRKK